MVELAGAGSRTLKPGQLVAPDAQLSVVARPRWASRGGEKLEAALDAFDVDPTGLACLDAGASTGGFTDVLLARGARVVYAVDVGRGQLLDRLARDPRVVSMERTNLRGLQTLPEPIDLATLDLSFISLRLVLPAVRPAHRRGATDRPSSSPQFEAGREAVLARRRGARSSGPPAGPAAVRRRCRWRGFLADRADPVADQRVGRQRRVPGAARPGRVRRSRLGATWSHA